MDWINTLFGIIVGAIVMIPAFFIHKRSLKAGFAIVAVLCALGASELSKSYVYPHILGLRFEREIVKHPLFGLIAKNHPKEFAVFVQQIKQGLVTGQPESVLSSYSTQLIGRIFYQHLQTAPNEVILQYLGSVLELYRFLYTQDPRAVLRMEYGQTTTGDLSNIWEDNNFKVLLNHLLQLKTKVIEASIATPIAPPTQAEAAPLLQGILQEMSQKYGEELVKQMFTKEQTTIPANMIAPLIIDFYARIGMQGPEKAGIMMRYIAGLKVKGLAAEEAQKSQRDK